MPKIAYREFNFRPNTMGMIKGGSDEREPAMTRPSVQRKKAKFRVGQVVLYKYAGAREDMQMFAKISSRHPMRNGKLSWWNYEIVYAATDEDGEPYNRLRRMVHEIYLYPLTKCEAGR
jgi:hypothetical protein